MRQFIIVVFALVGILQFPLAGRIEIALQAPGVPLGPFALFLLAPILELGGGILLLLSSPDTGEEYPPLIAPAKRFLDLFRTPARKDPFKWASTVATELISSIGLDKGPTARDRLLAERKDYLENKEQMRGFGFLSLGFAIQVFALLIDTYIPVWLSGVGTIAFVAYFIYIQKKVRKDEDDKARRHSKEKVKKQLGPI